MKAPLLIGVALLLASSRMALAIDCKAILDIPAENASETSLKGNVDVNGLAKRLLNASGDAEVLSKTRELLQKYPLDQQSLRCSQLTYLACGVLNEEKTTPLQARVDAVERMTKSCHQIKSEAIAQGSTFGPSEEDEHFTGGPVNCKSQDGNVTCVFEMESSSRNRNVAFMSGSAEMVDEDGEPYDATSIRIGQKTGQFLRYEFKADTRTKVVLRFDGAGRTSKIIQTLSISPFNVLDNDRVDLRYRNVPIS